MAIFVSVCSTYTVKRDETKIRLREKILIYGAVPRANIRPTDLAPIVIPADDDFYLAAMRWGWRVPWDKKPLINAKSETILNLPTFKPYLQNRCLLVADGFYEKGVRFTQDSERIFYMAGLWKEESDGEKFSMLTTTPNDSVAPFHHRMPFILSSPETWLGDDWQKILESPDKNPLQKIQKQPELF